VLAVVYARLLVDDVSRPGGSPADLASGLFLLNRILTIFFSGAIAAIYVIRRPALAGRHDIPAFVAAMYASFLPLSMRPVASLFGLAAPGVSLAQLVVSSTMIAIGAAFSLYAVGYLRLNFSILPEARSLTTSGPYRLVRHPVYLGEIISAVGIALLIPSWLSFLLLASFIAAQWIRTSFEETLLRQTIPSYEAYAARTRRLIPWLA